ncbi:MFS transporter [Cryobacterium sp. LW097]|uniref:DHA2 family efflux MFS transporter permease subunit n=1 Tax=unclassified Cryobacterium TaxID=2649013 RepID=UPI000B4C381A|nr:MULTISPECIES: DHA2 family efflux MFS transporter permease subunit [unclassified Cryobacterium]ASD21098.1 MFS transporter [Cryobacterium sp. LW097]TFC55095.1 DHA2 family efflux MFS transporter permease subunit [Cryobacterium sp. TMB3-1-2]TFC67177.1 DHA2 family efflux MFS transporter permease subunit [Cryobacterium sp. TMB3-15]TFC73310.1 DHA2 family efflux MFS transporter permease subunit [Cryobacterium sp. TMB3-10]TFD44265.1 DHA2 family efflux MFS transporter permease subunit [Cryobacterium 
MTDSPAFAPDTKVSRRAWQALIVLMAGMFMALLDTTIVNVALPSIRTSLDASEATLSWIISGYALAFGLALIPAGRIGDRIGHKWVFFTGLALFTVASLACGLAQNDLQLIIARVVQGLAGGMFVPAVTAVIQLMFPAASRGKAFAIMGSVIGVSTALGPIVGGLIIEAFGVEEGWRLVFWVNLPIGIVALIAAAILLPTGTGTASAPGAPAAARVDGVGLLLLSAGLVALLVPLIEGQDRGWPLWTYLVLAAGVLLIVAFGAWEVALTKRGSSPLVPPHLFSHPAFTGGVILALVYFAAFTSIFFTISILWQAGLGHTALESGLVSIPFAIGSILGASQSNRLTERLGRTVLVGGVALVTVGLIWVWLVLLLTVPADLTNWILLPPLFIAGLGSGCFIAPNVAFIVATVDPSEAGAASGVIGVMQRVGSAAGIAVVGSVFFGTLVVAGPGADAVAAGFTHSATLAMAVSAGLSVVALLLVFLLPKRVEVHGGR